MSPLAVLLAALIWVSLRSPVGAAIVEPGELITPDHASKVIDLVSPGNFVLVEQGMRMKIVPADRLEFPPLYSAATEKYAPQVWLNEKGELKNYVAGLPFPFIDPNDPQAATKIVWNFSYRPEAADDVEIRNVEMGLSEFGPAGHTASLAFASGGIPFPIWTHRVAQQYRPHGSIADSNRSQCSRDRYSVPLRRGTDYRTFAMAWTLAQALSLHRSRSRG